MLKQYICLYSISINSKLNHNFKMEEFSTWKLLVDFTSVRGVLRHSTIVNTSWINKFK